MLRDVLDQDALEQVAHNRVETVENLVQKQVLRTGGQRQNQRRLPLHALGHIDDLILGADRENGAIAHIRVVAPVRVQLAVEHRGVFDGAVVVEKRKVGNKKAFSLCRRVVKQLASVDGDRAAVGAEYAREHAQQR